MRIRKAGYQDRVVPIGSYTAGNLGDLILTPESGGICAQQRAERTSDGFDVVHCVAPYDQPPRVHLPAAAASSAYAVMEPDSFVTLDGQSYPHARHGAGVDSEANRHASAIYEIKIGNGQVESFRPAVLFDDSLFIAPLIGQSFDGLISKRSGEHFEIAPSLPVRVRILPGRFHADASDTLNFGLKVSILNLASAVTAADGRCMPGLAGYGSQAPFASGTDVFFTGGRVPSMHLFGDDEFVFDLYVGGKWSGRVMSPVFFFTPLDLIKNPLVPSGTYLGYGHGTPGYIPTLSLGLASGGGAACTPK